MNNGKTCNVNSPLFIERERERRTVEIKIEIKTVFVILTLKKDTI